MYFTLSEEQEMLRKQARSFFATECSGKLIRGIEECESGYSPQLWQKMAELGWLGLIFPEEYGGSGASFLSLIVLLEEIGRACLPSPFLATILGAMAISDIGHEEQKQTLLPIVSRGEMILSLALTEPIARYDPTAIATEATIREGCYVIEGSKLPVPYAHIANAIICVARTKKEAVPDNGMTLFLINRGIKGMSYELLDAIGISQQYKVEFRQVKVAEKCLLGSLNQGWHEVDKVMQYGVVTTCAEMVGGAQKVLEMTVDYANQRFSFGRPIGAFQLVHNRFFDMMVGLDGARFLTYQAAYMLSKGLPCQKEVAMAKAWISENYRRIATSGCVIHGGIGVTFDHDTQLYFRHSKSCELAFGDADFHKGTVADQLVLGN
jgi:alkylation response protein AidB-like acyl-CoA dehydrogenase